MKRQCAGNLRPPIQRRSITNAQSASALDYKHILHPTKLKNIGGKYQGSSQWRCHRNIVFFSLKE